QVYVEGLILEANVTREKAFGVEYVGAYGAGNAQRAGFLSNNSSLMNLLTTGAPTALGGLVAGIGIGPSRDIPVTGSAGTGTIKVNALNALIKAIASHSSTNIPATPQILALDNTEATFEAGDTEPIRNSTIGQGGGAQFSNSNQ